MLDDEFTVSEETLACAFEYAVGRKSYVVASVVRDILENVGMVEADKVTTTNLDETTTLGFKPVEGTYPDYRKLMKQYEEKKYITVKLNPRYIKQALEMFKDDDSIEFSVPVDDKFAPAVIKTDSMGVKKTALIMPLKS